MKKKEKEKVEKEEESTPSPNIEIKDEELASGNTSNLFNFSASQVCFCY
jgi:hypothetical protein